MTIARLALLFVVFLDIMSQGLVIPVLTTILLNTDQPFLPSATTGGSRQFDFGLVMAVFFLSWFLGAAFISKLSDSIGRKEAILICLVGNLLGYILTIVSLQIDSFALLLVARGVSGFTAGNQPIAQAALVDMSENNQQKTRFIGLVLVSLSLGLVVGPLMSGLMSDQAVLGSFASNQLPFYAVSVLVIINFVLIILFFKNEKTERRPVKIKFSDVFLTLWLAAKRPTILKLSVVFFFSQLALNTFYIFMDSYFFSRFQFGTLENAFTLVVLGAAMGLASAFLVSPINERFGRIPIICVSIAVMAVSSALSIVNPSPIFAYILIVPLVVGFAIYYPTIVTMFSLAVDEHEQGWIMGVTVALYTLGAGIISVVGGELMPINIHLPFIIAFACAVISLILIFLLWRNDDIRRLSGA